jgi:hypothetical protein
MSRLDDDVVDGDVDDRAVGGGVGLPVGGVVGPSRIDHPPSGKLQPVHLDVLSDVVRRGCATGYLDVVVQALQESRVVEVVDLFPAVSGDRGREVDP